jgi:hypothetical protein
MDQDEYLNPFMNDVGMMEEQLKLLEQFAKQKSSGSPEEDKKNGEVAVVIS